MQFKDEITSTFPPFSEIALESYNAETVILHKPKTFAVLVVLELTD